VFTAPWKENIFPRREAAGGGFCEAAGVNTPHMLFEIYALK
jgi:hypothetical protein